MQNFIYQLKVNVLSWLLFHANKGSNNQEFYKIKNALLEEYGVLLGTEIQEITGKSCYSCNGTGTYRGSYYSELCYNCIGTGFYKEPFWTVLQKYYFGTYYFHKPLKKLNEKPEGMVSIKGYIHKTESEYTLLSRLLLGMYFGLSKGTLLNGSYINVYWACKWYWRRNWLRSWLYIFSYGRFPPVVELWVKIKNSLKKKNKIEEEFDLPF